jgi:hypothetical protein
MDFPYCEESLSTVSSELNDKSNIVPGIFSKAFAEVAKLPLYTAVPLTILKLVI